MLLGRALLLGAVAYGTYDITSLATIRGWPVAVSAVDIAWGMAATTLGALSGAPACSTRPPFMTTSTSASVIASSWSCVT